MSEQQTFSTKAKIVQNYLFSHLSESKARTGILKTSFCGALCTIGLSHTYLSSKPLLNLRRGAGFSEVSNVSSHIKIFRMKPWHVFPEQLLNTWSSGLLLRKGETFLINKGPKQEVSS